MPESIPQRSRAPSFHHPPPPLVRGGPFSDPELPLPARRGWSGRCPVCGCPLSGHTRLLAHLFPSASRDELLDPLEFASLLEDAAALLAPDIPGSVRSTSSDRFHAGSTDTSLPEEE